MKDGSARSLLRLFQLVSPALPVGAYSYSEGLETLVQAQQMTNATTLQHWLEQELRYGAMRTEAAVLVRLHQAAAAHDLGALRHWNSWLSAFRETAEIRQQSWQMGRSLLRLLLDLGGREQRQERSIRKKEISGDEIDPELVNVSLVNSGEMEQLLEQGSEQSDTRSNQRFIEPDLAPTSELCLEQIIHQWHEPCNYALAFAVAAVQGQIDRPTATLGYLHSWAANLINAGVRLIPLGQTQGQEILLSLSEDLERATGEILSLTDDQLQSCGWGLSLASMQHETLYSRLFRS